MDVQSVWHTPVDTPGHSHRYMTASSRVVCVTTNTWRIFPLGDTCLPHSVHCFVKHLWNLWSSFIFHCWIVLYLCWQNYHHCEERIGWGCCLLHHNSKDFLFVALVYFYHPRHLACFDWYLVEGDWLTATLIHVWHSINTVMNYNCMDCICKVLPSNKELSTSPLGWWEDYWFSFKVKWQSIMFVDCNL